MHFVGFNTFQQQNLQNDWNDSHNFPHQPEHLHPPHQSFQHRQELQANGPPGRFADKLNKQQQVKEETSSGDEATEQKSRLEVSDDILSQMPATQRQLYLRIQQHQQVREEEKESTDGESSSKSSLPAADPQSSGMQFDYP